MSAEQAARTTEKGLQKPLDGHYFHRPDVFEREQRFLFRDSWLCAGHASEASQLGDYFTRTLGREPLLFVRTKSGIKGYFNVCRHRGTRLVADECGRAAKNFQCPYHAWTYSLNGSLIGAPRMKGAKGYDPEQLSLLEVPTQEWNGFVFFKLGAGGHHHVHEQLDDFPDISPYGCEDLVSTSRRIYQVSANWKLLCQNYGECYHCALVHPQLNDISNYLSGGDQESGECFVGGPMKLNRGYNTLNMTGNTERGNLPGIDAQLRRPADNRERDFERGVFFYNIYPNLLLSLHRDYVLSHTLWPTGPETTTIICDWLFHQDQVQQPDFEDRSEVEFWHLTNQQDWNICEQTHIGVRSSGYQPVTYHAGESCLAEFDRWYLETLCRTE